MTDEIGMAITILREMAEGRVYTLKYGLTIGMAEDGHVGFVIKGKVCLLSEITFYQLVSICREGNVDVTPSV